MREAIYEALLVSERQRLHAALRACSAAGVASAPAARRSRPSLVQRRRPTARSRRRVARASRSTRSRARRGAGPVRARARAVGADDDAEPSRDRPRGAPGRAAEAANPWATPRAPRRWSSGRWPRWTRTPTRSGRACCASASGASPGSAARPSARSRVQEAVRIDPRCTTVQGRAQVLAALGHAKLLSGRHRIAPELLAKSAPDRARGRRAGRGGRGAGARSGVRSRASASSTRAWRWSARPRGARGGGAAPDLIFVTYSYEA